MSKEEKTYFVVKKSTVDKFLNSFEDWTWGFGANTIIGLEIGGYKSFGSPVNCSLKDLSILAGKNSTGKSSFIQPLLLLKQTLVRKLVGNGINSAELGFK